MTSCKTPMGTNNMNANIIETDVVIIGAGPSGLFQVFELGLLDIHAHVIETLDKPGGQCAELYPSKPIFDIPAFPSIGAQELVDNLMAQIAPFAPTFHFGQQVTELKRLEDERFFLKTTKGKTFISKAVIVAGGVGSFEPVKLKLPGVAERVGNDVFYSVKDPSIHAGKDIVILGGGDSALDWALDLQKTANSVLLIHRSEKFKAAPASVSAMQKLCDDYEMQFLTGNVTKPRNLPSLHNHFHSLKLPVVTASLDVSTWITCWSFLVFRQSLAQSQAGALI